MSLDGRRVLITGGTGSLGRRLAEHLLRTFADARLLLFSRDEKKQYDVRLDLERKGFGSRAQSVIGDVRDAARVREVVRQADCVIHAAAMKHITHAEAFPAEAVATNVGGAQNLLRALAERSPPIPAVFISTDKAVDPINVYGMTKAIQERLVQQADIPCAIVRYGNVLNSSGSVVPFFQARASAGLPLPVTDERMTRFFITFGGAIALIMETLDPALQMNRAILVPRLRSARITDVAGIYSERYGVPVQTVGIRPGEKIHERLLSDTEANRTELFEKWAVVSPTGDAFQTTAPAETPQDFISSGPVMLREEVEALLIREGELEPVEARA